MTGRHRSHITLLAAVARAGKSAMAHTIAHLCAQRGILLSSFFPGRKDHKSSMSMERGSEAAGYQERVLSSDAYIHYRELMNSSRSLYLNPFVTHRPWVMDLSSLSLTVSMSVTTSHPRPLENFSGTMFLSSLAGSNSFSPRGPLEYFSRLHCANVPHASNASDASSNVITALVASPRPRKRSYTDSWGDGSPSVASARLISLTWQKLLSLLTRRDGSNVFNFGISTSTMTCRYI